MNEMYPVGYDPSAVVAQAQTYAPQVPAQFPQMTPGSFAYHGPTHAALSQAFQNSLMNQAYNPGLLSAPSASQMGILSNDMPQATPVSMPNTGGGPLGANQYYRLTPEFWNSVYQAAAAAKDPNTAMAQTAPNVMGNGNGGPAGGEYSGNHGYSPDTGYGGGLGGLLGGMLGRGDTGLGGQLGQSMY